MRRLLVLTALALITSLAAGVSADEPDAYDRLIKGGVLEVAVYNRFPPYSYEQNGQMVGVDVDLAAALAKSLGLSVKIRAVEAGEDMDDDLRNYIWKGTAVSSATSDVMMHIGDDPAYVKRQHQVAIIGPYYHESVALAFDPARIKDYADIASLSGHRIAVGLGSISDLYLSGMFGPKMRDSVDRYKSTVDAVACYVKKTCDAVMMGRGELEGISTQLTGKPVAHRAVAFRGLYRNEWDIGFAVKASNPRLRDALSAALVKMESNGELTRVFAHYGVQDVLPQADTAAAGHDS